MIKRNLPNLLSVFRILLIPAFLYCYLTAKSQPVFYAASGILVLSGLTDVADGLIARKFGLVSRLGKILDPLADKFTQAAVCIAVAIKLPQLAFLLAIFVVKEFVMLIAGARLLRLHKTIQGSMWFGKLATGVFYVVMFCIVTFPSIGTWASLLLVLIAAAFMVFAFCMYIPVYLQAFKQN